MVEANDVVKQLATAAGNVGLSWASVVDRSKEVILFGSVASGVASRYSDIDVLCVGYEHSLKTRALDLLTRTEEAVVTEHWLTSELAGHIAKYGIWLKGEPTWAHKVRLGEEATLKKRQRLFRLVASSAQYWHALHPLFRARYLSTIKRELQRLSLLNRSISIPPTPLLDAMSPCASLGCEPTRLFLDAKKVSDDKLQAIVDLVDLALRQPLRSAHDAHRTR